MPHIDHPRWNVFAEKTTKQRYEQSLLDLEKCCMLEDYSGMWQNKTASVQTATSFLNLYYMVVYMSSAASILSDLKHESDRN